MSRKAICAVKAVIVKDGKILLMKQVFDWGCFYDLPGGRVEHGVPPEDHLKTEVMEEIGVKGKVGKVLGVSWYMRETDGDHVVCILYEFKPENLKLDITKNPAKEENITETMWVTPEEFYNLDKKSLFLKTTSSALKDFFEKLQHKH